MAGEAKHEARRVNWLPPRDLGVMKAEQGDAAGRQHGSGGEGLLGLHSGRGQGGSEGRWHSQVSKAPLED
eukprot:scaffold22214_cov20-Tisochrysis_lutea.AAC.1